jgi:signal transduction histidine kinase
LLVKAVASLARAQPLRHPHHRKARFIVSGESRESDEGTDRRRLDAAVRELAASLVTVDDDLVITWTPPSSAAALGMTPDDLQGVSVLALIHPDDHAVVRRAAEQSRRQPGTKGSIRVRVAHPAEPGVYFQGVADHIFLADDLDEILVALHPGILPDEDEVDDAPEVAGLEPRRVVETATVMPQGMLLVSREGRVLQRNSRVRQLLGPIVDSDVGEAWLEHVAPAHRETAGQVVAAAASGERSPSRTIAFHRDDEVLMLRIDAVPFEEGVSRSSYVVHFLDVTAERLMQQRLLEHEKLAALGQMAAGVAHELNNPLHLVVNFAETLQHGVDELRAEVDALDAVTTEDRAALFRHLSELRSIGDRIVHHGQRASAIAKGMLTSVTTEDRWTWIDVNPCLAQAIERARMQTRYDNEPVTTAIEFEPGADLPKVHAPPAELTTTLVRLVANALYATAERAARDDRVPPAVTVASFLRDGDIEIRIRDNGSGIAPDVLPNVFHPFFTTKPPNEGVGLGLSQCYSTIDALSGSIDIDSQLDTFTEVTIRLPTTTASRSSPTPRSGTTG